METRMLMVEGVFFVGDRPMADCVGTIRSGQNLDLMADTEAGCVSLYTSLMPFLGERVQLAAHHLPDPLDVTRWGLGSCRLEGLNEPCPAEHQFRPNWIWEIAVEGILTYDLDINHARGGWAVVGLDGQRHDLDFHMLPGHTGRVAVAPISTVEAIRELLESLAQQGGAP